MHERRTTRLRGVLFDVDGTLLDSNDGHAGAWVDVLIEFGYDIRFDRVRPLIGVGSDKLVPELTGLDHESLQGKRLVERKKAVFEERYLPHLRPTHGARRLLERMAAEGLRVVIATSAGSDEMHALLERAGVADLIDDATSSADVESSKPDPDVVGSALRKGRLRADEAVMIGDTPYDIKSAGMLDVATIALRCGGWWDDDSLSGAVALYDDPDDLLAHYDESPLGEGRGWRAEGGAAQLSAPPSALHHPPWESR
jgi:phosphoglycolate phosphatase-like HAD superfamily hydrolase